MTPQNKNLLFNPEYSVQLLQISEGDLTTAFALISSPNPPFPNQTVTESWQKLSLTNRVFNKGPVC